ncbi:unnamed protein product [Arctogadus glacialis]
MAHHIPSRSLALATASGPWTRLAGSRQQTGAGDLAHHGCLRYRTRPCGEWQARGVQHKKACIAKLFTSKDNVAFVLLNNDIFPMQSDDKR